MTSPFLRLSYMVIYYDKLLGMYVAVHNKNKVHGQSRSTVPRSPGSGVLVPCGHGWIFMAAQLWHWVAGVASAADVGCMHGAGGGDAGCAAKRQWLDRACDVAVVPLGTVSAALTLHSQMCLHMWQYVEPLLVHTR